VAATAVPLPVMHIFELKEGREMEMTASLMRVSIKTLNAHKHRQNNYLPSSL
jgi:hypothetical protein